jgi:hypothetical protein
VNEHSVLFLVLPGLGEIGNLKNEAGSSPTPLDSDEL